MISLPTSEESAQKEYKLYEFAKYQPEAYAEAYEKAGELFTPGAHFHLKLAFMHEAFRLSDGVRNLLKLEDGDAEGKAAFTAKSCLETLLYNLKKTELPKKYSRCKVRFLTSNQI